MAAAVRLYEADMRDLCMSILTVLIRCGSKEAHILYGHCLSDEEAEYGDELANTHYKIACEMGSAVGCYNLYLNFSKTDTGKANKYLKKAEELGWKD